MDTGGKQMSYSLLQTTSGRVADNVMEHSNRTAEKIFGPPLMERNDFQAKVVEFRHSASQLPAERQDSQ
ncbi:hypothetical protein E2C01_012837 [Portunus trituberculatus]|uniref:Uncharacterized protein n=1 Tax=Portunus trituberculatus TaxID=210409 RepID=A0A5B7DFB9_PORTR|nr:hypothetical protein [Portunus trituberculatus]